MNFTPLLKIALFAFVILLVALLYWLTLYEPEDPCAAQQGDVSAAVLADEAGDQDALVNRAIIVRGACNKEADQQSGE